MGQPAGLIKHVTKQPRNNAFGQIDFTPGSGSTAAAPRSGSATCNRKALENCSRVSDQKQHETRGCIAGSSLITAAGPSSHPCRLFGRHLKEKVGVPRTGNETRAGNGLTISTRIV
jgi:hypothetical protein